MAEIWMNPADRQSIEHFVRSTLGCHCPDEDFQSIAIDRLPGSMLPCTRLVIGDRLLIYVLDLGSATDMPAAVSTLTAPRAMTTTLTCTSSPGTSFRTAIRLDFDTSAPGAT